MEILNQRSRGICKQNPCHLLQRNFSGKADRLIRVPEKAHERNPAVWILDPRQHASRLDLQCVAPGLQGVDKPVHRLGPARQTRRSRTHPAPVLLVDQFRDQGF